MQFRHMAVVYSIAREKHAANAYQRMCCWIHATKWRVYIIASLSCYDDLSRNGPQQKEAYLHRRRQVLGKYDRERKAAGTDGDLSVERSQLHVVRNDFLVIVIPRRIPTHAVAIGGLDGEGLDFSNKSDDEGVRIGGSIALRRY